jgi:hypothetical protein
MLQLEHVAGVAIDIGVRKHIRGGVNQMAEGERTLFVRRTLAVQESNPLRSTPSLRNARMDDHLTNENVWEGVRSNTAHPEVFRIAFKGPFYLPGECDAHRFRPFRTSRGKLYLEDAINGVVEYLLRDPDVRVDFECGDPRNG